MRPDPRGCQRVMIGGSEIRACDGISHSTVDADDAGKKGGQLTAVEIRIHPFSEGRQTLVRVMFLSDCGSRTSTARPRKGEAKRMACFGLARLSDERDAGAMLMNGWLGQAHSPSDFCARWRAAK